MQNHPFFGGKPDTFFVTTFLFFLLAHAHVRYNHITKAMFNLTQHASQNMANPDRQEKIMEAVRKAAVNDHTCLCFPRSLLVHTSFFLYSLWVISFFSFLFSFPSLALLAAAAHSLARVAYLCSLANNLTQNGPHPFVAAG
jgi:hypothetical protein